METDHNAIRRGDCPVLGNGLGHAWVSAGDDDPDMGCSACGARVSKVPPRRSWLESVKKWGRRWVRWLSRSQHPG